MMIAHARDSDWMPSPVPPGPPAIDRVFTKTTEEEKKKTIGMMKPLPNFSFFYVVQQTREDMTWYLVPPYVTEDE